VRIRRLSIGAAAVLAALTISPRPAAASCLQSGVVVHHSAGGCSWDNYVWAGPFSNSNMIFVLGCGGAWQRAVGAVGGTLVNGAAVWHAQGIFPQSAGGPGAAFGMGVQPNGNGPWTNDSLYYCVP
jgi:hypothetical protein